MSLHASHDPTGTSYGSDGVAGYAKTHSCSDLERFLNIHLKASLKSPSLSEKEIVDLGCGAGHWSLIAAKTARLVEGIDIQPEMIQIAQEAASKSPLNSRMEFAVGTVSELPYPEKRFDHALSVNVGCNLPIDVLLSHIKEMGRILKNGGTADFTAPSSLDVVFTDGKSEHDAVVKNIQDTLKTIEKNPSADVILTTLGKIKGVLSATFAVMDGYLKLVTSDTKIESGSNIWRKLEKVVLPNRYYTEQDYLDEFRKNGFKVLKIVKDRFSSDRERIAFNSEFKESPLGQEYVNNAPFAIYQLQKGELT